MNFLNTRLFFLSPSSTSWEVKDDAAQPGQNGSTHTRRIGKETPPYQAQIKKYFEYVEDLGERSKAGLQSRKNARTAMVGWWRKRRKTDGEPQSPSTTLHPLSWPATFPRSANSLRMACFSLSCPRSVVFTRKAALRAHHLPLFGRVEVTVVFSEFLEPNAAWRPIGLTVFMLYCFSCSCVSWVTVATLVRRSAKRL